MSKKTVAIKIESNTKQAVNGINAVVAQLNALQKQAKMSSFAKLGAAITGLKSSLSLVGDAFKAASAAIKECNEAYKVQEKAEKALEQAARNNPYINGTGVRKLKEFAGELQKVTNYGDEGTIDIMAQLVSSGRDEAEVMKIVGAAADYAAATHTDLASAAKLLNATYSGAAGALGKNVAGVKDLTAEQLKNGDAIDLVAKKYKGFAEAQKDVNIQAKNAFGDFKEQIGDFYSVANKPMSDLALSFWTKMSEGMQSFVQGLRDINRRFFGIKHDVDSAVTVVKNKYINKETGEESTGAAHQSTEFLEWLVDELEQRKRIQGKLLGNDLTALIYAKEELNLRAKITAEDEKQAQIAVKKQEQEDERGKKQKTANDLAKSALDAYDKAVQKAELEIAARRQLGETVTQAEENQIMYAAKKAAYENMIISAQGAISGNLDREKKTREEIAQLAAEIAAYDQSGAGLADKYAKKNQAAPSWEEQKKELEDAKAAIEEWNKETVSLLADGTDEKIALEKKYKEAVEQINREIAEGEKQTNEQRFKLFQEVFNQIGGYVTQSAQLISDAMAFQLQAVQNEKDYELAALEEKYRKGEITEEEYNDKKVQIEKDAAQKEYKIKMWEWAANIAQATANVAMAAIGAAAQTSGNAVARVIAMSLIGAAAGVQMASLIASKPVPPSFATGGIVQGSSWSGDNVRANVNSGEMILTAAQQKALWETANGRGASGGNVNIVVNNKAANLVDAKPSVTKRGIELLIDARVKQSLSDGKYNSALTQANQLMNGVSYGI